ncbi:unnamed protein product, partial [Candidula unifasciata]
NKFSAIDIAADVANRASQVHLALGVGTWILPRCFGNSLPYDFFVTRSVLYHRNAFVQLNNKFIAAAEDNFDHETSGVRPNLPPLFAPISLNDDIPLKLMSGKVRTYGHLTRLDHNQAHMRDGRVISDVDAIIFCTGYYPDVSFVDLDVLAENGKMEMYRMMFPLKEKHRTIAFIGQVSGDFPLFPLFDVQAKLATRVMAGKHLLPPLDKMKADMDFWNAHTFARTGKYCPYFIATAILTDSIAEEIGIYPSFWKVFFKNPALAFRNWYGPIMAQASVACCSQYQEGCASVRQRAIKEVDRPDIREGYRSRCAMWSVVSVFVALLGFLWCRYQEKIYP